jgi:hypothetical protein
MQCWYDVSKHVGNKVGIAHDLFNGHSINHHERHSYLERAITAERGRGNLVDELDQYVAKIDELTEHFEKLYIVRSNHDDFLEKYLNNAWYVKDPQNHLVSLDLAKQVILGNNPLEWYARDKIKNPDRVVWFKLDEDFYIERIKVSEHGHLGSNGGPPSIKSIEKSVANAVIAHSHTPEILRNIWRVGTSTYFDLRYTKGASSWYQTSCLIYPGGHRQFINSVHGKYRLAA